MEIPTLSEEEKWEMIREMGDDARDIRAEQASRYWLYYANGGGEGD